MQKNRLKKQRKPSSNLLDGWSVPHFLFGVVAALVGLVFAVSTELMLATLIIAALIWEFFEFRFGIRETRWNVVSDLCLPLLAFFLTLFLVPRGLGTHEHHVALFIVSLLIFVYLNVIAWQARFHQEETYMN